MNRLKRLLPIVAFVVWDLVAVALAFLLSVRLIYSSITPELMSYFPLYVALAWTAVLAANALAGCYGGIWRHVGMSDSLRLFFASMAALVAVYVGHRVVELIFPQRYPLTFETMAVASIIGFMLMIGGRFSVRITTSASAKFSKNASDTKRVLIYGAGEAGRYLYDKLTNHPGDKMLPVVFLDDDPSLKGKHIGSAKIYGDKEQLTEAIKKYNIDEVIVAVPTADSELLDYALKECRSLRCSIRRFGNIGDIDLNTAGLTDINLEELLRRESIELNMQTVRAFIEGKTVLVTGGAGSIGSEICRQVLAFGCDKLIIFDIDENGLFHIDVELREQFKDKYYLRIGSTRDVQRLDEVFREFSPNIVFHAAAQKHVPMTEASPREAVKTNVFGTKNVAQAAVVNKTEKVILISTDKAVNPTNIMGATKRIAEMSTQMIDTMADETAFAVVRFGNVLGSNGSVVPLFRKQIEKGGPVTVTHPDMRRYFMTIPEAVQLVLEAGAIASGGEILVLDMGKPVKIYDLACDLIRLSGFQPDTDIKIEFTGLRPGDKLFEEISLAEENVKKTANKKIFVLKALGFEPSELALSIKDLEASLELEDNAEMFHQIKSLVPTLNHSCHTKTNNSNDN